MVEGVRHASLPQDAGQLDQPGKLGDGARLAGEGVEAVSMAKGTISQPRQHTDSQGVPKKYQKGKLVIAEIQERKYFLYDLD